MCVSVCGCQSIDFAQKLSPLKRLQSIYRGSIRRWLNQRSASPSVFASTAGYSLVMGARAILATGLGDRMGTWCHPVGRPTWCHPMGRPTLRARSSLSMWVSTSMLARDCVCACVCACVCNSRGCTHSRTMYHPTAPDRGALGLVGEAENILAIVHSADHALRHLRVRVRVTGWGYGYGYGYG